MALLFYLGISLVSHHLYMAVLFECSHTEMKIRTLNPHDCRYEVGYMIFQMSAKMDSVSKFGSPRGFLWKIVGYIPTYFLCKKIV